MDKKTLVLLSPFLIILVNVIVAIVFGQLIGKWAFIPIILIEWCLFFFFILQFGKSGQIKGWLKKPLGTWGWSILALSVGFIPLPLFIAFANTLSHWTVWLPWILLAVINPWLEELYWRGLLMDYSEKWRPWISVLFTSFFYSINHAVFGINSEVNSGFGVIISTFIMGIIWGIVYQKTGSLRWCIAAHFLVDFFSLSAPAFLDLFEKTF